MRSMVACQLKSQSQQLVELQSRAWGVRLASRLGCTTVTLVSDSEVAIAQLVKVRAKRVLGAQQSLLRGLARRLVCSGLVVSSYGYSNQMGYQTSDFRLLWTITPNPPPQHPFYPPPPPCQTSTPPPCLPQYQTCPLSPHP